MTTDFWGEIRSVRFTSPYDPQIRLRQVGRAPVGQYRAMCDGNYGNPGVPGNEESVTCTFRAGHELPTPSSSISSLLSIAYRFSMGVPRKKEVDEVLKSAGC